ncbi:hypothetical protein ABZ646_21305 [Streptomyces sp. NPDC007162]|uniref:hypothetical protein n=1 Tax=Streptomyces sp. NPDC007162 TaxID=3156917 RepID=UPI0033CBFBD4
MQRATTASARVEFVVRQVRHSVAAARSSSPQAVTAPAEASLMSYGCCGAR